MEMTTPPTNPSDLTSKMLLHKSNGYVTMRRNSSLMGFTSESLHDQVLSDLNHAVLGLSSEVGELAQNLRRFMYADRRMDPDANVLEIGDIMWFLTLALDANNRMREQAGQSPVDLMELMRRNVEKLDARAKMKEQAA